MADADFHHSVGVVATAAAPRRAVEVVMRCAISCSSGGRISLSRKWRTPSRSYTLRMAWTSSGGTALAACAPAAARFDMLTFGPVQMMVGPVESTIKASTTGTHVGCRRRSSRSCCSDVRPLTLPRISANPFRYVKRCAWPEVSKASGELHQSDRPSMLVANKLRGAGGHLFSHRHIQYQPITRALCCSTVLATHRRARRPFGSASHTAAAVPSPSRSRSSRRASSLPSPASAPTSPRASSCSRAHSPRRAPFALTAACRARAAPCARRSAPSDSRAPLRREHLQAAQHTERCMSVMRRQERVQSAGKSCAGRQCNTRTFAAVSDTRVLLDRLTR